MSDTAMKIDPARAQALATQFQGVSERIAAAAQGRGIRLVAVSKLKPANDILALHQSPINQLHFGENYAQELSQKAELLPRSIQWHFIGGLQSGHCKQLAKIPNLFCVSSVDTLKKAQLLNKARGDFLSTYQPPSPPPSSSSSKDTKDAKDTTTPGPLNVHIQINTSGEASKSGCPPGAEALALARAIASPDLPHLRLLGLMTIGAIARSHASGREGCENEDFLALRRERDAIVQALGLEAAEAGAEAGGLELSMGMSEDFEGAIALGSDEVRVGSTIFGQRPVKSEAKVVDG